MMRTKINEQVNRLYDKTKFDHLLAWYFHGFPHYHFGYFSEQTVSHRRASQRMTEVVCALAAPNPGEVILDAGCGYGATSIWLAQTFDVTVIGICPNENMIARCREYARKSGVADRVSFKVADMTSTDFDDGSFDIIIALESASHTLGPAVFYSEFRRLLKTNGRAILADFVVNGESGAPRSERVRFWKEHWQLHGIATYNEHIAEAGRCGLSLSHWRDISAHVEPSVRRVSQAACRTKLSNSFLWRMRLRNDTQNFCFLAVCEMGRAFELKEWAYTLFRFDRQDQAARVRSESVVP
jgi:tocopherol O-methyltransferase